MSRSKPGEIRKQVTVLLKLHRQVLTVRPGTVKPPALAGALGRCTQLGADTAQYCR